MAFDSEEYNQRFRCHQASPGRLSHWRGVPTAHGLTGAVNVPRGQEMLSVNRYASLLSPDETRDTGSPLTLSPCSAGGSYSGVGCVSIFLKSTSSSLTHSLTHFGLQFDTFFFFCRTLQPRGGAANQRRAPLPEGPMGAGLPARRSANRKAKAGWVSQSRRGSWKPSELTNRLHLRQIPRISLFFNRIL